MQLSRILKSLAGGFVAELVNKLVPLLILRFVVQKIGVEGFGLAQFSYWLIDLAVAFVVFGYTNVAAVEMGKHRDDPQALARIISEVLTLKLGHAALAFALLMAFVWSVPAYQEYRTVVTTLSFILFTSAIDMSFVHIGTSRMLSLSVLTILVKLTSLGAILVWVDGPDDLLLFALLYFGANGVLAMANFAFNVRRFPLVRPTAEGLRRRFAQSLPFALTVFLMLSLERYDVFVVESLHGTHGAGLYGGPVRIAQALVHVVAAIGTVFFSEVVATKDRETATRHVALGAWVMYALLLPIAFGSLFTGSDLLELVLGPEFRQTWMLFSILLAALIGHSWINLYGMSVLMFHQRAGLINAVLAGSVAAGIPLAVFLEGRMGLKGIAWATFATRTAAGGIMMLCSRRYLARLPWRELATTLIPALGMVGVLVLLLVHPLPVKLIAGAGTFGLLLLVFNRGKVKTLVATARSRAR